MPLPTSRPRTYSNGDAVEPDDINDIFDQIIRLQGGGELDVALIPHEGIDVEASEAIRLAASPRTQLYFEGEEEDDYPFCSVQWTPADNSNVLLDGGSSGGFAEFTGIARLMIPIRLPRGMQINSITIEYREDPTEEFTAILRGRNPIGAVVTDHATGTTANGAAINFLVLTPGSPVAIENGFQYWLSMFSTGSGPRFYCAKVKYSHPAP